MQETASLGLDEQEKRLALLKCESLDEGSLGSETPVSEEEALPDWYYCLSKSEEWVPAC